MEPPGKDGDTWAALSLDEEPLTRDREPPEDNGKRGRGLFKGMPLLTVLLAAVLVVCCAAATFLYARVVTLKSELREIEGRMAQLGTTNEALKKEVSSLSQRVDSLRQQLEAKAQEAARQKAQAESKKAPAKKPGNPAKKPGEGRR